MAITKPTTVQGDSAHPDHVELPVAPVAPLAVDTTVADQPGAMRVLDIGPADPDAVETVKLTAPSGTRVTVPAGEVADSLKALGYK